MAGLIKTRWRAFLGWIISELTVTGTSAELAALDSTLDDDSSVIYICRHPSRLLLSVFAAAARRHHFPEPKDHWRNPLTLPTTLCGAFSLRKPRGDELSREVARTHRDNLIRSLSEIAGEARFRKIYLVPISLFPGHRWRFSPRPILDFTILPWGDLWVALLLILKRRSLKLSLGPIIKLQSQQTGSELIHLLGRELYAHEKLEFGLTPTKATKSQVLAGTDAALTVLAAKRGADFEDTQITASSYLDEIASRMSPYAVTFFKYTLLPLINRVFSSIKVSGLEHFSAPGRCPVIILPNHRSHFDYLLISTALYLNRLPLPHIAAGNNLNFFPVGGLLRGAGAFFIRRKIDNDPLYKFVLEKYLAYVVKRGEMLEFFIEGGRSRSGLIQPPRYGLLSYIIRCINDGGRRDAICLPVSIDYERVPEDRSLVRELTGTKKRRENFFQLLKSYKVAFRKFGEVSISFGSPLSVKEALNAEDTRILTKEFAQSVISGIQAVQRITLTQLVATVLSYSPKHICPLNELREQVMTLLSLVPFSRTNPLEEVINGSKSWEQALRELEDLEIFQVTSDGSVTVNEKIEAPENTFLLGYYRSPVLASVLAHLPALSSKGYSASDIELIRKISFGFLKQVPQTLTEAHAAAAPLIEQLVAPYIYSLIQALNIWIQRDADQETFEDRYFVTATEAECTDLLHERLLQRALDGSPLPLQASLSARSAIDHLIDAGLLVTEAAEEGDNSKMRFHLSEEKRPEAKELYQQLSSIYHRRQQPAL